MKNTFGSSLSLTIFGESHGAAVGAVLDGMAAGVPVDEAALDALMDKRRARGDGLRGRTMYHPFRWDGRSNVLAAGMALCFAGVAAGALTGQLHMLYVPIWRMNAATVGACLCYVLYGGLCALPLILNLVEDLKWRYWMCKI